MTEITADLSKAATVQTVRSHAHVRTIRNPNTAIKRNDPCPCESGKKYKGCCMMRART